MANDLATLKTRLATELRDSSNETWTADELGQILTESAHQIWPRVAKPVRETVTLADDDDQYTLTTVAEISRVDLLDSDSMVVMTLPGGSWEYWNDQETVGGTLWVSTLYANTGDTLRVHGYAPYDLSSTLPSDRISTLILAIARLEAFTRMLSDRARFENWANRNQKQNVSVNELSQMVAVAGADVQRLRSQLKTWRRPVPA